MNIPYTYLIVFKPTRQWYYGVRYAKDCHPNELWKTYFTSSKKIKLLLKKHGKEAFTFEIRRTFSSKESALEWEKRVLIKMNIMERSDNLNMAITGNFPNCVEYAKKTNLEKLGVEFPFQSKEIQKKIRENRTKKDYILIQESIRETSREKYGVDHFFSSVEIQEKVKNTFKEKYGVERVCDIPHVKEKKKQLNLGKIWVKHPEFGQRRIYPEELDIFILNGYTRGLNNKNNRL